VPSVPVQVVPANDSNAAVPAVGLDLGSGKSQPQQAAQAFMGYVSDRLVAVIGIVLALPS